MNTELRNEDGSAASTGSATEAPLENIDDDTLPARIERLSPRELDALPFGVVRLDAEGIVTFYSRTEAEQSGYRDRRAIGLHFFTQLAPCLSTPDRLRSVDEARRTGTLDIAFEQIGDFDDADRELQVRVISASGGGAWVFLQRPCLQRPCLQRPCLQRPCLQQPCLQQPCLQQPCLHQP